jgi:hypothetical protein
MGVISVLEESIIYYWWVANSYKIYPKFRVWLSFFNTQEMIKSTQKFVREKMLKIRCFL